MMPIDRLSAVKSRLEAQEFSGQLLELAVDTQGIKVIN